MLRVLIAILVLTGSVWGQDWNQFRGATGDGLVEGKLPESWSMDKGIRWSVELPGRANSSPAVTKDRIDITTATDDHGLWVMSFERATGKLLHKTRVGTGQLAAKGAPELWTHRHNAATPTPIASNELVWAYFGSGHVACLEALTGQPVWQRNLVDDYGAYDITFGMGSSPRLVQGKLLIACMTKGPSYLLALDPATGKELWRSDRHYDVPDDHPDSYSSPVVWEHAGQTSVLLSGAGHVDAYELEAGRRLWSRKCLMIDSPYGRVIAAPVVAKDMVVATSPNPAGGGKGRIVAIDKDREHWSADHSTPDSSTPVIVGNLLFMASDAGIATCLDVRSGKQIWQKRLGGGPYHASLIAGDDKIYFLGIDGVCTVMKADRSGKIVSQNTLPGTFYATPAAVDGTLYLRAYERLYAIGE